MSDLAPSSESRKLSAILFSDIVGYSRLMEADEDATMALLTEHNALVSEAIRRHKGTLVKYIGDAALAVFDSAADAIRCALAMQRAVAERNSGRPEGRRFLLRIGVAVGDVVTRDGDVFGNGVNLAARIQPLAEPGGVCLTEMAHGLVAGQAGLRFESMGPRALKNIKLPVVLYRVSDSNAPAPRRRFPAAPARGLALVAALSALAWGAWRLLPARDGGAEDARFFIAVAPFTARTAAAAEQAAALRTIVRRELEQDLESERDIHVGGSEIVKAPGGMAFARQEARRVGADMVIWGDVLVVDRRVEIQPFLNLARPSWGSYSIPAARGSTGPDGDPLALARSSAKAISAAAMLAAAEYFLELDPEKSLSIARRVDPPSLESRLLEARALAFKGDPEGAERAVRAAQELAPKSPEPRRARAILLMDAGRNREAAAELASTLAADPKDSEANRLLGKAYERLGRVADAEAGFRKAAALKPDAPLPHLELGALQQARGRWRESADEYGLAWERDPDDEYARLLLSQALFRAGRAKEAAAALDALVREPDPAWPFPIAHALAGELSEAELLTLAEKEPDPYQRLERLTEARYYLGIGRLLGTAPGSKAAARELLRAAANAPLKHISLEKDLATAEIGRLAAP